MCCAREEQYRQLWAELERFARAHKATSGQHAKVLDCLLECKKPAAAAATADDGRSGATTPGGSPRRHGSELELKPEDAAWKELERSVGAVGPWNGAVLSSTHNNYNGSYIG